MVENLLLLKSKRLLYVYTHPTINNEVIKIPGILAEEYPKRLTEIANLSIDGYPYKPITLEMLNILHLNN